MSKVNELELDKCAMEMVVEEFQGIHDNLAASFEEFKKSVSVIKSELHQGNAGARVPMQGQGNLTNS